MNSCLYECRVMHHRLSPREYHFEHRIFLFSLDLDEVDDIAKKVWGFGHNTRAIYAFNDRDHLAPGAHPVRQKVMAFIREQGASIPGDARIQLITLPRVLGYIFNPVSFYFIYTSGGDPLCSVIEVGNTFREIKPFLASRLHGTEFHLRTPKHFYVSPFSSLDTEFDFRLRLPGGRLDIHIHDYLAGQLTLVSSLIGSRSPLTSGQLAWFSLKYPFITLKVIFLIHWHAFVLWLKRFPFFAKNNRTDLQKHVLRPHPSLSSKASS